MAVDFNSINGVQDTPIFETNIKEKIEEEKNIEGVLMITPQMFGTIDGTNDLAAFQAAVDSGAPKIIVPNGTYYFNGSLNITRSVEIDFGYSTIIVDALKGINAYGSEYDMCSASNYSTLTDSNSIEVSNPDIFSLGDIIHVQSDELYCTTRANYPKGFNAEVVKITGNRIYFSLENVGYDIAGSIVAYCYKPITVTIKNIGRLKSTRDVMNKTTNTDQGIYLEKCKNSYVLNCVVDNCEAGIRLDDCVGCSVIDCRTEGSEYEVSSSVNGYGISSISSTDTYIKNFKSHTGQHGITSGGYNNVVSYNLHIDSCDIKAQIWNYSYGAHENIYSCLIENSSLSGCNVAGNTKIYNCKFYPNHDLLGTGANLAGINLFYGESFAPASLIVRDCTFGYGDGAVQKIVVSSSTYLENPTNLYMDKLVIENCKNFSLQLNEATSTYGKTGGSRVGNIGTVIIDKCENFWTYFSDKIDNLIVTNSSTTQTSPFVAQYATTTNVYQKISNVVIRDCVVDGVANAIRFYNTDKITIDNVKFNNITSTFSMLLNATKCYINNLDAANTGSGLSATSTIGEFIVNNSRFHANSTATLFGNCTEMTFRDCVINASPLDILTRNGNKYKLVFSGTAWTYTKL